MAKRSSNSSRTAWRDYPHWSSVERFVEQVRRLNPLLVLLFGSVVTGEFTQHSDADVLVVFEHPQTWETVYACSDGVVQPVVKTRDELTTQIAAGEPFLCEIVEEGKVLFDAGGVYDQLRRHVAAARERWGLERTPDGWRWTARHSGER
jgi:predicted nucleotidyltransferase